MVPFLASVLIAAILAGAVWDGAAGMEPSGADLPAVGLGTAGLSTRTESVVSLALELGIRLIDTAQAREWYDEESVGRAVRKFADLHEGEVPLIVTKIHPRSYGLAEMKEALRKSKANFHPVLLHTVLLHAPFCWSNHCSASKEVSWQVAWRNLEQLKDEFGVAHIGVSNFDIDQLQELVLRVANRKVSVVQNWMDPLHQDTQVRNFCELHNIQYMAYSSFGTQWQHSRAVRGDENPVMDNPLLLEIARAKGCSVAQLVMQWLFIEGVVAIPRSSRQEHIVSNFANASITLTEEDLQLIRGLDSTRGTPWD